MAFVGKEMMSIPTRIVSRIMLLFMGGVILTAGSVGTAAAADVETRHIKGYVRDSESGEALPNANILLKGTRFGAATNVDGFFVIVNVPVGTCSLLVRYIGYEPLELEVNNNPGGPEVVAAEMRQTSLEHEAIEVKAEAEMIEIPEEVSKITLSPRQLFSLPSIGEVDVFRSLQLMPGISGANEGSSGLYVRGGTPDQNLVLLDGMTIYHVDHFFGFFSAFNADAIKDIQVYKGGFPAVYGGRTSSVVDLTGKTGNARKPSFGMGANLLSGNAVLEAPLFGKGSFLLSTRRSYTDFVRSSLYNNIYGLMTGDEETPQVGGGVRGGVGGRRGFGGQSTVFSGTTVPDFYFYDINSKLTLNPTEKDIVSISLYRGKDNLDNSQDFSSSGTYFRFPGSEDADTDASMQISNITEWGNAGLSAKWSRQWLDRFYYHILIASSSYFSNYDRNSTFENRNAPTDSASVVRGFANASEEANEVKDLTFRFDNELQVSKSHQVKAGLWLTQFDSRYVSTFNDTTSILNLKSRSLQTSLYLQDRWQPWAPVELILGARFTNFERTNTNYIEPRASFRWYLTDKLKLKGAWGWYNQFVNRITNENVLEGSRDFWILADEEIAPGFAEHRIVGASYETDRYLFDIEAYYKDMDNLVEFSRRFNAGATYNNRFFIGSGYSKGIEFLLQKKYGRLTGWIGYTLGKVEHTFPDIDDGNPFPAAHDRTHEVNAVGKYSWGGWSVAATWVYATGRAYTAPESQYFANLLDGSTISYIHVSDKNSHRLPDYHRLDLSLSRRFTFKNTNLLNPGSVWDGSNLDVGVSIFNVYNRHNVWYREYNLDVQPVAITDAVLLGFTPTIYAKINF
ncbi:TonB-dependent receptor domain-containing protein [candidate division KSB1 bacterium]